MMIMISNKRNKLLMKIRKDDMKKKDNKTKIMV